MPFVLQERMKNMEVKIFKGLPEEARMIRIKVFVEEQGFHNEQAWEYSRIVSAGKSSSIL